MGSIQALKQQDTSHYKLTIGPPKNYEQILTGKLPFRTPPSKLTQHRR